MPAKTAGDLSTGHLLEGVLGKQEHCRNLAFHDFVSQSRDTFDSKQVGPDASSLYCHTPHVP